MRRLALGLWLALMPVAAGAATLDEALDLWLAANDEAALPMLDG